jgi:hypothetical protein
MSTKLPPAEHWYCWRELKSVEGESRPRLLVPWSDPHEYEFPMDWIFRTQKEALKAKRETAPEENWVLVRMTLTPVRLAPPEPEYAE